MKDLCDLCTLNCPTSGCTVLSHESCLKEAIQSIKPSVTCGEVISALFDTKEIATSVDKDWKVVVHVPVKCNDESLLIGFPLKFWNSPYQKGGK